MKIDFLFQKGKPIKNLVISSGNSETQIFSNFEKLSLTPGSPIWKNEVIIDNQMDAKPSEELQQQASDEKQQDEPKNSEQSQEQESQNSENSPEEKLLDVDKQEQNEQNPGSEVEAHTESQEASVQKQEEPCQPPQPPLPQLEHKHRIVVKHSILGNKIPSHDPNVLVESTSFTSIGKIQPFLITISTNAALVIDYHCHLTTSEVCGYLAGNWDVNSHSLNVTDAFPCKCRLGDYESAPLVESEIRKTIKANGLTLVGWYHSHPTAPPTPSVRDIETQLDYQLRMKGSNDSTYLPCIGIICSPYNLDNPTFESNIVSYWVVPPPENKIHEYGKPMFMTYSVCQDQAISQDVLMEMKKCADFYKPEKDFINFSEVLKDSVTFLEKLKQSLSPKFPLNHQKGDALWNLIQDMTTTDKPEQEILDKMVEISNAPSVTPPPVEKSKFNIPAIPPPISPLSFKSTGNNSTSCTASTPPYFKSHSRSKSSSPSSGKRSSSRENKNLASLNNYFVGSDLAALFGTGKFPGMAGLDPATKSLLNLNNLSLGGMFLPPMAAAAAAAAAASYKSDPGAGLMKPPPPPPNSYYPYPTSRNSTNSRTSSCSTSRSQNRNIPSTSRDMPPPNKVPKLDVHHMANFFIPPNLGKNCTITNRPSTSTSSK